MSKQAEFAVILKMNAMFADLGADEIQRLSNLCHTQHPSNGEVLLLSGSGAQPDRFINSTLRDFVDFLGRVTLRRRMFRGLTEPEADAGVAA